MDLLHLINTYGLFGLFLNHLLAASIIPFPSEPATILAATYFDPWAVFAVSLAGNFIGGLTIYWIGLRGIRSIFVKRNPELEKRARKWIDRHGFVVLLAAPWIPIIGDPALIVAGMLKMDVKKFSIYTLAGKAIKIYALVVLGITITSIL